jgi:hypothetical protein
VASRACGSRGDPACGGGPGGQGAGAPAGGERGGRGVNVACPLTEKREAVRKAIASTKTFEGINGKWSFDENGDVDYDTMSGFKAVKADGPIGCKFQFETILE